MHVSSTLVALEATADDASEAPQSNLPLPPSPTRPLSNTGEATVVAMEAAAVEAAAKAAEKPAGEA